jgi:membrane protein involved in colicin uptake
MSGLITFIRMFLGLASEEAVKAYERKKKREKAEKAAKKAKAEQEAARKEAEAVAARARLEKAEVDRKIAAADRKATLAQNELDIINMRVPHDGDVDDLYPLPAEVTPSENEETPK